MLLISGPLGPFGHSHLAHPHKAHPCTFPSRAFFCSTGDPARPSIRCCLSASLPSLAGAGDSLPANDIEDDAAEDEATDHTTEANLIGEQLRCPDLPKATLFGVPLRTDDLCRSDATMNTEKGSKTKSDYDWRFGPDQTTGNSYDLVGL